MNWRAAVMLTAVLVGAQAARAQEPTVGYKDVQSAFLREEFDAVTSLAQSFILEHPDAPEVPRVWLWLALSLERVQQPHEALREEMVVYVNPMRGRAYVRCLARARRRAGFSHLCVSSRRRVPGGTLASISQSVDRCELGSLLQGAFDALQGLVQLGTLDGERRHEAQHRVVGILGQHAFAQHQLGYPARAHHGGIDLHPDE